MPITLEERAQQFVTKSCSGKINIDWKAIARHERDAKIRGNKRFAPILNSIIEYLKERGVLVCAETPGSFFATGYGIPLNPSLSDNPMIKFSFADEENARAYYSEFFKNAQYGIILHQTVSFVEKAKD